MGCQTVKTLAQTTRKFQQKDFIKSKLENPQDLEYEKTFYPFCILSKKRYVGNKYEFDVNKFSQNSMGIVLKRRDNAKIVKKIFGGRSYSVHVKLKIMEAFNRSIEDIFKACKDYPRSPEATLRTL